MSHRITIEQVDKEIAEIEKAQEAKKGIAGEGFNFDLASICAVINKVKPILKFVRGLLFWKPKWQAIIDDVINATSICDM